MELGMAQKSAGLVVAEGYPLVEYVLPSLLASVPDPSDAMEKLRVSEVEEWDRVG